MSTRKDILEEAKSGRGILVGVLILLALVLLFSVLARSCNAPKPAIEQDRIVTDTVYVKSVERIYVLPEAVYTPEKVVISTVPDTVRRKEREQGDIVTGVRVNSRTVEVQTIDPRGVVISSQYRLPDVDTEITVDENGKVSVAEERRERRKRFWEKAGKIGIAAGSFAIGFLLGK